MKRWQRIGLAAAAVIVPALSCGQRSLVLLDVRASTEFTEPSVLLDVRLSVIANDDVTTRFAGIHLQTNPAYQIGMYLPSDMTGTVTFRATVDNGDCILGTGTATATGVQSGETSTPIELVIHKSPEGCTPIGDGGPGGSGSAGTGGASGAGGMTGVGGVSGTGGVAGGAGTTGTAGRGGTTGTAGVGGTTGSAGRGGTSGTAGSSGAGGTFSGTAGVGGTTGTAGRGGTTGTAGVGNTTGTAGVGGTTGAAGRGGTSGTAGVGGTVGAGGAGGAGNTLGTGGIGNAGGVGGAGGVVGAGGVGPGGATGAGGSGVGGTTGCGSTACFPPYMCNTSGACVCSETPAQACARAGGGCGYVVDNCGQQLFCSCKIAGTICDTNTRTCMAGCTTGTGGIVTADIICPVDTN